MEMVLKIMRACVVTLLLVGGLNGAVADPSQIEPAAHAVAQSYFDALRAGDGRALLALFAGKERSRSEAQLSDPAYTRFLSDRYRNARLEVVDGGVRSGVSYVDIKIWISATESFRERLVLQPSGEGVSLHIVARKELLD